MIATPGIMCNHCSDVLTTHGDVCRCKNVAITFDQDDTLRLYIQDITTARRVLVFTHEDHEVARELLTPFNLCSIFIDYQDLKHSTFQFQPTIPYNKYLRVTDGNYDKALVRALDVHKIVTSDGYEAFQHTALENPPDKRIR